MSYIHEFTTEGSGDFLIDVAGETLGKHALVYRSNAQTWMLADADTVASMPVTGLTLEAIGSGLRGTILLKGYVADTAWSWTTGGDNGRIYASPNPGVLTQTAPTPPDTRQVIAVAFFPTGIWFDPSGLGAGQNDAVEGASYVIDTDGTYIWAKSGSTGAVVYGGPNNEGATLGTDAAAVIQATIDSFPSYGAGGPYGGMIFIRGGTYVLSSRLDYSEKVSITTVGESKGGVEAERGTWLRLADNADVQVIYFSGTAPRYYYLKFKNLTIDGNKANQTVAADAVFLEYARRCVFEDIGVFNAKRDGISFSNSEVNWLVRSQVQFSERNGFSVSGSSNFLTDCVAGGCDEYGFLIGGPAVNNHLSSCSSTDNTRDGFRLQNTTGVQLFGCASFDNVLRGYTFLNASFCKTINCDAHNNGSSGLRLDDTGGASTYNGIEGCTFYDDRPGPTQDYGVNEVGTCNYNIITGCTFNGHQVGAMSLVGANTIATDNPGYNPVAASTPAVGASPVTFGPYNYAVLLEVAGGNVTSVTVRAQASSLTAGQWMLYPSDTCVIVYVAPPTVTLWPQ